MNSAGRGKAGWGAGAALVAIALLLTSCGRSTRADSPPVRVDTDVAALPTAAAEGESPIVGPVPFPTAVIVDQLALGFPNPDFVSHATEVLEQAGYRVTYVPGERATVEFFRTLPAQGYDLILLRVHSSAEALGENGEVELEDFVSISTGEPLSEAYRDERNSERLGGILLESDDVVRFTIRRDFILKDMVGHFDGAVIVLMGCDGTRVLGTAEALHEMGASHVVGWNGRVSVEHTDTATEYMLRQWLLEGVPIREAVHQTREAIGPDPFYGAELFVTVTE